MTRQPWARSRVIGRCWACGDPVRTDQAPMKILDRSVGVHRLFHGGSCADRAEVMFGADRKDGDAAE